MKTTEKYPTYVKVDKVDDDKYLVNLLLRKEQLDDLKYIAHEYRSKRQGRYHAMVVEIENAIALALGEE